MGTPTEEESTTEGVERKAPAGTDDATYRVERAGLDGVVADLAEQWERYVAHGLNDTSLDERGTPLPDEPELMRVWRQIIGMWDELREEHARNDRQDHPGARDLARIQELNGRHGLAGLGLASLEEDFRRYTTELRAKLQRLKSTIVVNTRDTADERGPTIARLRDLVEDPEGDEPFDGKKGSVRLAVEAWQEDPADGEKKHHAQMLVRQYVSRRRSQGGIGRVRRFSWAMPTDETDLDVLFEKAETRRKAQKKNQGRNREDKSRFFMRVLEDLLR